VRDLCSLEEKRELDAAWDQYRAKCAECPERANVFYDAYTARLDEAGIVATLAGYRKRLAGDESGGEA
jgi:hypothetical protein